MHQGEGHIKVKVKYLHPFKFYVAHTFCKRVVCIRLNTFLFLLNLDYCIQYTFYFFYRSGFHKRASADNHQYLPQCVSSVLAVLRVCVITPTVQLVSVRRGMGH